jgi:hypothetical protein
VDESERPVSASSGRIERALEHAMRAFRQVLLLASGVQGGHVPAHDNLSVVLLIIILAAGCAWVLFYLRRRYRRPKMAADEWQALAVMGELCPHGWQAQINLYGWGAPVPDDAPPSRTPLVELEWRQFDEESGRVTVVRRVWAPSIGEALQAMVEDRQTDLTLERIEQEAAGEEGLGWED